MGLIYIIYFGQVAYISGKKDTQQATWN